MGYIDINNLQLNNYKLSFQMEKGFIYGIYGKRHDDISELLKKVSGINPNNQTCLKNDKDIFDNKDYFKERIYLDLSKKMVETLNDKTIKENLKSRYNVVFNEKEYKRLVNLLNIRSEITIKQNYDFTDLGNNLTSFAIYSSLNYPLSFIDNPLLNIPKIDSRREIITKELTNKKKHDLVMLDASSIDDFKDILDYVVLLGDYEEVFLINPKVDKFIICDDYLSLKKRIFKKDNMVIILNDLSKEEFKSFKKEVRKYKEIDFKGLLSIIKSEGSWPR